MMAEKTIASDEPAVVAESSDNNSVKLCSQFCSHPGCTYHAIVRKPLCVFHIKEDESELSSMTRHITNNRPAAASSIQQLEERAADLEAQLKEVREQIKSAKRAQSMAMAQEQSEETTSHHKKWYRQCKVEGCSSYACRGGVCVRHGARAKKPCTVEGCTNQAINSGVCLRHGAKVKLCEFEGCTKLAQRGGICYKHGAEAKICEVEDCTNQARKGGVCRRHGAKRECSFEDCTKHAQISGVCWSHGANEYFKKRGKEAKICEVDDCTNQVRTRGRCRKHDAMRECSFEDCEELAQKGGVCWIHGDGESLSEKRLKT